MRINGIDDELRATEAGDGHITLLGHDEVAGDQNGGRPWTVVCETCEKLAVAEGRDQYAAALLGYWATEAEANAARAGHIEESGDR